MSYPNRSKRAPRLDFRVDQGHIACAVPKDSGHCMIADALAEAMPGAESISVDLATIRFTDPQAGLRYIYLTPPAAQVALIAFDQGEKPEPFNVKARAAQVVLTGRARRATRAEQGLKRSKREPARLYFPDGASGGTVPEKRGGTPLPVGELAHGQGVHGGLRKPGARRGKRREFGLRALIR